MAELVLRLNSLYGHLPDASTGGSFSDKRLPGQRYDEESGVHYNRHRYDDPQQGRYITQDPLGLTRDRRHREAERMFGSNREQQHYTAAGQLA